jgi:hypothetical protein
VDHGLPNSLISVVWVNGDEVRQILEILGNLSFAVHFVISMTLCYYWQTEIMKLLNVCRMTRKRNETVEEKSLIGQAAPRISYSSVLKAEL